MVLMYVLLLKNVRTSSEDIVAYKVYRRIKDRYYAPFRNVEVPEDNILPSVTFSMNTIAFELWINSGYHSIVSQHYADMLAITMARQDSVQYLYSADANWMLEYSRYKHIKTYMADDVSYVVMEVIIPKGTEYFKGKWDDSLESYASTNLVLGKIVTEKFVNSENNYVFNHL